MYFNRSSSAPGKRKSAFSAAPTAMVTLLGLSAAAGKAGVVLTNQNSSVTPSTAAVTNWTIGSTNQLDQDSFWYRIGDSPGQSPISDLTPFVSTPTGLSNFAEFTYGSTSGFDVVVKYMLTGSQTGSQSSDLVESIDVSNDGMSSQTFHLFEYTNFNLDSSTTGQTVTITGGNTATDIGDGMEAQTVVSPEPSKYEAANTAASPDLLSHISNASTAYTLQDVASAGPGDGEWAFEWDIKVGCNSSEVISIDKDIQAAATPAVVPEPAVGGIVLLGLGGLFMKRPRRRGGSA
jgi:hypothetical protein